MAFDGCFVTGTDTGVGKTLVSAALLHTLARHHRRVVGMKPVAAGLIEHAGAMGQRRRARAARGVHRGRARRTRQPGGFARPPVAAHRGRARRAVRDRGRPARGAPSTAGHGRRGGGRRCRRLARAGQRPRDPGRPGPCHRRARGAGGRPAPGLPEPRAADAPRPSAPTACSWRAGWPMRSTPTCLAATKTSHALRQRLPAPLLGTVPWHTGSPDARQIALQLPPGWH